MNHPFELSKLYPISDHINHSKTKSTEYKEQMALHYKNYLRYSLCATCLNENVSLKTLEIKKIWLVAVSFLNAVPTTNTFLSNHLLLVTVTALRSRHLLLAIPSITLIRPVIYSVILAF